MERGRAYLERKGAEFLEESAVYRKDGKMQAIYLKEGFGGFAVHLVRNRRKVWGGRSEAEMGNVDFIWGTDGSSLIAEETGPLEKVEHFTRALSGAEVNVAIGLTRLGHRAEYLTRLGEDPFGYYIADTGSQKNGIGTAAVHLCIRYTVPGSS